MYAIVDIAGQQFRVEKDKKVYINRVKGEVGTKINLNKVLFINNEKEIKIGSPYLKDASVTGKIISHIKDKKIKIFKKKRRKGYKVLTGHRQYLTEILIEDISERKAPKETTAAKIVAGKEVAYKQKVLKPAAAKKDSAGKSVSRAGSAVKKKPLKKEPGSKSTVDKKPAVKAKSKVTKPPIQKGKK
jgi:large subunit ribosomal protein L21